MPFETNAPPLELDVLSNDQVLQSGGGAVMIVSVTPTNPPLGNMAVTVAGDRLLFGLPQIDSGEQEYVYTIRDLSGRTAQGHVTVVVLREGVRANADFFSVMTDSTANELTVLANDAAIPAGSRPLAIVAVGIGVDAPNRGGTVSVAGDGSRLIYTPAAGFTGEETFTYTMTDSRRTDTAKVVVQVTSGTLNANDDAFTVFYEPPASGDEPRTFTLSVLANDRVIPEGGQLLTITGVGINDVNATNAPDQQGLVSINADGTALIYEPRDTNGPFPYVERFTYEITDGSARRTQAVVRVEVQQRVDERDLETLGDRFTVERNSLANAFPVLANDGVKPATAAGWTITGVTDPAHGVVVVVGSTVYYSPQTDFVGTDGFTYTVSDGLGGTGSGNVTVAVGALRTREDGFAVLSGTTNNMLEVLANDPLQPDADAARPITTGGPADQGGFVSIASGGSALLYSPRTGFSGTERFPYAVADDTGSLVTGLVSVVVAPAGSDRDTGLVTVTVHGVNDLPVPASDTVQAAQNATVCLEGRRLVANDFDVENDRLVISSAPSNSLAGGRVVLSGGLVYYTSPNNFLGLDGFTTEVMDEHGGKASTTVEVTVVGAIVQKITAPILSVTNGFHYQTVRITNPLTNELCGTMYSVQVLCTNLLAARGS